MLHTLIAKWRFCIYYIAMPVYDFLVIIRAGRYCNFSACSIYCVTKYRDNTVFANAFGLIALLGFFSLLQ